MDMHRVVSGVALRTLATRGRKRAGPTSEAPWEGWSEAEGPKGNTACDHPAKQQLCAWGGMEQSGRSEGQYRLRSTPDSNTAYATPATLPCQLKKEGGLKSF